ncbi:MAG: heavy-metal-associated domain-containing protein [Oscillospiraceae bacterium]|nr:heavy-metal-associated domain-containing protein [Oscillospiraceae bacterium]
MLSVTVQIEGMACSMCEAHIKDVISKIEPNAKKLTASHTKGEATFLTETPVDEARLRQAIDETGYRVVAVSAAPQEKKGWRFW